MTATLLTFILSMAPAMSACKAAGLLTRDLSVLRCHGNGAISALSEAQRKQQPSYVTNMNLLFSTLFAPGSRFLLLVRLPFKVVGSRLEDTASHLVLRIFTRMASSFQWPPCIVQCGSQAAAAATQGRLSLQRCNTHRLIVSLVQRRRQHGQLRHLKLVMCISLSFVPRLCCFIMCSSTWSAAIFWDRHKQPQTAGALHCSSLSRFACHLHQLSAYPGQHDASLSCVWALNVSRVSLIACPNLMQLHLPRQCFCLAKSIP